MNCVWLRDDDLIINEDKVIFNRTGSTPQLIHGNGPAKKFIELLLEYAKNKFNL